MRRHELLARLRTQSFDLLVIGGGIVGAGIARDAALRGLRVGLIDKGDFASGTSSKTSKLIHGGLRYVEHGRVKLVMEGLRERAILRTIAPSLVSPLPMLLPVYRGAARAFWKIVLGVHLYRWLAMGRSLGPSSALSASGAFACEPRLRQDGLVGAASYVDAQMDDARLCLAQILQAIDFGAICCNYVKLLGFETAGGRLSRALVDVEDTHERFEITAKIMVNATGPWGDAVRRMSDQHAGTRLTPTKGVHLITRRVAERALFVEARRDRRLFFILPWGEHSLIGTTDTPVTASLDALAAEREDVSYLLEEVNRLLPQARLSGADVLGTCAGARPLLAFSGTSNQASREHRIEISRAGLISILGGKYTTFRAMAKETVDVVVAQLRPRVDPCLTDQISVLETADPAVLHRWQAVTRRLPADVLARWLALYGTRTVRLLDLVERDPRLMQPACPHHAYAQAELVYAFREELACTVSDLLVRRTRIAFSACQGLDLVSTLRDVLVRYTGMTGAQFEAQAAAYRRWLSDNLACCDGLAGHEAAPIPAGTAADAEEAQDD